MQVKNDWLDTDGKSILNIELPKKPSNFTKYELSFIE